MRPPRLAPAVSTVLAVAAALVAAPSASAAIWTPVESGTTQDITAIDYRGPGQLRYVTAGGQILANGALQHNAPGFSFNDIAYNPSGTIGIAVGSNATLRRSVGGGAWTPISLAPTYDHSCDPGGPYPPTPIVGALTAVAWADDTTAYAVGTMEGVVLKSTNGGANWVDESRKFNGTCFAGKDRTLHDVVTVPGTSLVTFVDTSFGGRWTSSNGLASSTARQADSSVNCPGGLPRMALDAVNPNRNHVVSTCDGSLNFGFSENNGETYDLSVEYLAGSGDSLTGLYDVSTAGGSTVAVGNAGAILVSPEGRRAYFQRADGIDATNDWRAVEKADATNAAVGGRGGRLLVSATASTIPDIVDPAGTISGPVTATAGQPVTYTANVSDEPGGSGVDPAGFSWTSTGLPAMVGNPLSVTFPSAGYYTLRVAFRDVAGNSGTASLGVLVGSASNPPRTPLPGGTPPLVPPGTKTKNPTRTVTVPGGTVTVQGPKTCVRPGKAFTATLSWKRVKKKGNKLIKVRRTDFYIDKKRVKIDRKAPYRQRLTVKKLKPGTTHTLRARAFIKVKRGKGPTKSLRVKFAVCSS